MKIRQLVVVGMAFTLSSTASALPRFASRTNLPCQSCHVNPSGGGIRNAYGVEFGLEQLSVKQWQKEYGLEEFSPKISDFISYGADFRFLSYYRSKTNPEVATSSFFPMQMDLTFNLSISKKISLVVNPAFGPYNRLEAYAVGRILPASGYLKAGRFTASYGLRLDDHTSFARQATPFRNNMGQQTGLEFGFGPSPFNFMGAVTNGMRGDLDGGTAKAVFAKAEAHGSLAGINILAGVTSYNDVSGGERINLQGLYGALSVSPSATLVATVDQIRGNSSVMSVSSDLNQRNTQGNSLKQLAVLVEADYLLSEGVDLKVMYDFFDPNADVKSGSATRYSAGVEFFPLSGVELRPMVRYTEDTIINRNAVEYQLLLHLYL